VLPLLPDTVSPLDGKIVRTVPADGEHRVLLVPQRNSGFLDIYTMKQQTLSSILPPTLESRQHVDQLHKAPDWQQSWRAG
jgi:hypothetical protein